MKNEHFNGKVKSKLISDLTSIYDDEKNNKKENEYQLEINCTTPNEDELCKRFYKIFNKTTLDDLNINFPIKVKQTNIILKGDEVGIHMFNLSGITELVSEYYLPQPTKLSLLCPEIFYIDNEVTPYLKLNIYQILEYSKVISNETFDLLFRDWDFSDDEFENEIGYDIEGFTSESSEFIKDISQLIDYVKVEYENDFLNHNRIKYVENLINTSDVFKNILLIPILPVMKDDITGEIGIKHMFSLEL